MQANRSNSLLKKLSLFTAGSRSWRRPLFAGLVVAPLAMLSGSGCLGYLVRAGYGQMEILWNRRPVTEVLADPDVPEKIKAKLRHMADVREYAREHIGLETGETYTEYTHIDRDAAAYNVTAAQELALVPKTWWFPIVGRVPYLGYFSREEALEKERELKAEGLDTRVRDVPAYSTLGWFDDPVLSSQMRYSEWYLTSLVIHESTHATLWFPGDVNFNESFASFVEEKGSLQYVLDRKGKNSEQYRRVVRYLDETEKLAATFRAFASEMKQALADARTDDEKRAAKREVIESMRADFRARRREFQIVDVERLIATDYNNTHFLAYLRYESGGDFFEKEFRGCNADWACFFKKMRKLRELSVEERAGLLH